MHRLAPGRRPLACETSDGGSTGKKLGQGQPDTGPRRTPMAIDQLVPLASVPIRGCFGTGLPQRDLRVMSPKKPDPLT